MKSCESLSSNLSRVIDRSNLSPRRETDQINHLAASRFGDKFDRSMTLGKLLDNSAQFFILFLKYVPCSRKYITPIVLTTSFHRNVTLHPFLPVKVPFIRIIESVLTCKSSLREIIKLSVNP